MVSANVPCTSPQARTHREQTMHAAGSNLKYGLVSSHGTSRWDWTGAAYRLVVTPIWPARRALSMTPRQARFAMEFCAKESCGKCTPCRLGSQRGVETIEHVMAGRDVSSNLVLLQDLCTTMTKGSLCAMGGLTPLPVRSALTHFPEDFTAAAANGRGAGS